MLKTGVDLHASLKKYFGFSGFKGDQEKVIQNILAKKDTFVIMPTGGGKSLCYQLPALISNGVTLVVSPLIALMKNQVDQVRAYSEDESIAHFLNSTLSRTQAKIVRNDLVDGKTKLLYIAPETLTKESHIDFFRSLPIEFVAVDEAHCISEWGHDFRPEYRNIRRIVNEINPEIALIALTATATPKVQQDIIKNLRLESPDVFKSSFNRANLFYELRPQKSKSWVVKDLVKFIKSNAGKSGVVYCLSRKSTEEVAQILTVNGIKAAPYHAGLDATKRAGTQDGFLNETIDVIVATIAFGMGIDKPDVRFVVHYNIPKSLENYYQETGRAGRDGLEGVCIAYYSHEDIIKLEKFSKDKPVAEKEIANQLLEDIVAYSETSTCRRKYLLQYFGEDYNESKCSKMCDNCKDPKETKNEQQSVVLALEVVKGLGEKFGITHINNVLRGIVTRDVKEHNHEDFELFSKGKSKSKAFWNTIIRQALLHKLLIKEIENYGTLVLTAQGEKFIESPITFEIPQDRDYEKIESEFVEEAPSSGSGGSADPNLLSLLKDHRRSVAKRKNLPPFVIFQDPSLEDMATQYPITMEELGNITGVSKGKADKYGSSFIDIINQYVEENDIDRPEDFIVKSVVNKSGLKVFLIQNIDRKIPLEEMARMKNISVDEILEEIERIVLTGTRLNIKYYIDDVVDEEKQDIIYDYFSSADTDDLDEAYDELEGEDISLEEIQLMRIKFMSEVAN